MKTNEIDERADGRPSPGSHLQVVTDTTLLHESLQPLLDDLLVRIKEATDADTVAILVKDDEGRELLAGSALAFEEEVRQHVRVPIGQGFAGRIAATGEPLAIEDLEHAEVVNDLLRDRGLRSLLGVPLVALDTIVGVLHIGSVTPRRFTEDEQRLLEEFGSRIALAIDRVRAQERTVTAHDREQAARDRLERLQSVTAALARCITLEDVSHTVLHEGLAASGAVKGLLGMRTDDGAEIEVLASVGYPDDDLAGWSTFPVDASLPLSDAVREGEAFFCETLAERNERWPAIAAYGADVDHAFVALPLNAQRGTIGGIALSYPTARAFPPEDRELLATMAAQAGQALERAQLYEETEFQRSLLVAESEASNEGIVMVDRDGIIRSTNHRFREMWGIDDDVVGTPASAFIERVSEQLVDPELSLRRAAEAADHDDEVLSEIRKKNGTTIEIFGGPVRSREGEVYGRVWFFRDVTPLRLAVERQRFLAEASDLLASASDVDAAIQETAERAVERVASLVAVDRLLPDGELTLVACAHADPSGREAIVRARANGLPATHPARRVVATGDRTLISSQSTDFLESLGVDAGHLATLRGLWSRAGAYVPIAGRDRILGSLLVGSSTSGAALSEEEDLLLAEELARRIAVAWDASELRREREARANASFVLDHVADGVIQVDDSGLVRLWSRAAERLTGVAAADAVGHDIVDVLPGWSDAATFGLDDLTHVNAVPIEIEGRELWLSVSGATYPGGAVFAFRDWTAEQRLEATRRDFVSTASHELRTPLAAVYGAAMTLRSQPDLTTELQHQLFDMIVRECERLTRIVDDLLLADQLDAGAVSLDLRRCDISAIAREVVELTRQRATNDIEISFAGDGATPNVECDEDSIRQVLLNLLDNAIKYSPEGGEIEVSVKEQGHRVHLAVRDEGLGIPPGETGRIFEKFYRLDPSLSRGVGGTGLGLYISSELVRRMGGEIRVESVEGSGSTFTVMLPVR